MDTPTAPTLYQRFATAWLREALRRCGTAQADVSVWTEADEIVVWERRRSENDYTQPLPDDPARPVGERVAQGLLGAMMEEVGSVPVKHALPSMELRVGVRSVSDARRDGMGLLGCLAESAASWELVHPDLAPTTFHECVYKQLTLAQGVEKERLPPFWALLARHDDELVAAWAMRPDEGLGAGVYRTAPGLGVGAVMLDKLPRTADTLGLRLLGLGDVLRYATVDLGRAAPDAWERDVTRAACAEALGEDGAVVALETAPLRSLRRAYQALAEALG